MKSATSNQQVFSAMNSETAKEQVFSATSNQVFASIVDEFNCADELKEWAVRHDILYDPVITARLSHLRRLREDIDRFTSGRDLKRWAALNGLSDHPLVRQRLTGMKSCAKCKGLREEGGEHVCAPCTSVRCRRCDTVFEDRRIFYDHIMNVHHRGGAEVLQAEPFDIPPWVGEDGEVDEPLRAVYDTHRSLILDAHGFGGMTSIYNFPITNEFGVATLMQHVREIYARENQVFRINLIFGLILRNRETGDYRFFKPYRNEEVFNDSLQIADAADLNKFRQRVAGLNFNDYVLRQRPNTKWIPVMATNVRYWVNKANYPMGNGRLPEFLKLKKSLMGLDVDRTGRAYTDRLCAFRCLTYHRAGPLYKKKRMEFESKVCDYAACYSAFMKCDPVDGLKLEELINFEDCFEINVNVY
jgi:hypothetical protein